MPSALPPGPLPLIARVMGVVPLGIGLTVLGFLWGAPFDEFGSPPLVFRLFGSFIALAFVLTGLGMFFSGTALAKAQDRLAGAEVLPDAVPPDDRPLGTAFACPKCGAPLGKNADVSPHGDAKCGYCNSWFNIHAQ
jgi:hypothetical protein